MIFTKSSDPNSKMLLNSEFSSVNNFTFARIINQLPVNVLIY